MGPVRVDTAKRVLTVSGRVNQVTTLEFVANTPKGLKAYESAVTVDSDAATMNAALLLMGLDPARARVPKRHLDPEPPAGDPIEIFVEWQRPEGPRRIAIEELLWNNARKATFPKGQWVYTGSSIIKGQFLAELDGVLIGFVHSPAPLIDSALTGAFATYGDIVLNTRVGLLPGTPVTLIIQAVNPQARTSR